MPRQPPPPDPWSSVDAPRMSELCESFPELEGRLGVRPFDVGRLEWTARSGLSSGGREAAAFVLGVFNPAAKRRGIRFDLHHAMSIWDSHHRAAFLAWCRNPWWP